MARSVPISGMRANATGRRRCGGGAIRLATLWLGWIAACAAAPQPLSFPERMALESGELSAIDLASPDGSFSTKLIGRLYRPLTKLAAGDGFVALIDIGSATPVECTFFSHDLDLAAALVEFSERGFEKVDRHFGPVSGRQPHRLTAGVVGEAPTFALSWTYRVGTGMGLIKHRIASTNGRGLYCRHIEVGYGKTFDRLFSTMVRNFACTDCESADAVYAAVMRTRLRERPRGVEQHVVRELDGGSLRLESRSSLLVASLYGRLSAVDTVFVRFSQPDGDLTHAVYARSENGELVTNLSLERKQGVWSVSGMRDGAPFDRELSGTVAPVSTLVEVRSLRDAIRDRGSDASIEVRGWYPQIEPARLLKRVTVIGPRRDAEHFHAISKVGPVVVESVIDTRGETTWSRWLDPRIGELEAELVFSKGKP